MALLTYTSINELFDNLSDLAQREWIYANIDTWNNSPKNTKFFYITWEEIQDLNDDEIFENADGAELPIALRDDSPKEWMLVNVLTHIHEVHAGRFNVDVLIEDINYYRKFDTFKT